ncbi:MAG: hypothetical protein ACP5I1_10050 [Candidatus Hinthialibacter sp.]
MNRILSSPFGRVFVLVIAGVCLCSFDFFPEPWEMEARRLWKRSDPCVDLITFWDEEKESYRSLRAFLYTVPLERENKLVDRRLHTKMAQFLSVMFDDVASLDDYGDSTTKLLFEKRLDRMARQWKLTGRINPQILFEAAEVQDISMPAAQFDMLIFLERTRYEQAWNMEKKVLALGVNAAVFEMEKGEAVYHDRVLIESPWFGDKGTCENAEHAVLLKTADAMGLSLQKRADQINQRHVLAEKQQLIAQMEKERAKLKQIQSDTKELRDWVKQIEQRLEAEPAPPEIIDSLQYDLDSIKPLLNKKIPQIKISQKGQQKPGKNELTPEDLEYRWRLVQSMQEALQAWDEWTQKQEEMRQQEAFDSLPSLREKPAEFPVPKEPSTSVEAPPSMIEETSAAIPEAGRVELPKLDASPRHLLDRRWLLPSGGTIRSSTVPIMPVTGVIRPPKEEVNPFEGVIPDSFKPFETKKIPPPPELPAIDILPAGGAAG